jgi:hypothetical protein
MEKMKKGWKPFSPQKYISTEFKGKWRKQIPRSRLQQNKGKLWQRTKEFYKDNIKEEILQVIIENFMEMLLDMVNKNKQEALKKFQDKKENMRKHRNK